MIKLGAIAFGYGSYFHLVDKRLTCLFALAMKTYAHLRGEHEAAMAEKVSF